MGSKSKLCIVNGNFQPLDKAMISIQDLAILRGYGIFDFFRVSGNVPLFIDDHLERFYSSLEMARLDCQISMSDQRAQILELIARNNMPESGIRIVLTGGTGNGTFNPGVPNLCVTQEPIMFPTELQYSEGVSLITYEYQRDLPAIKTINYMTGIWLQEMVRKAGAFDVLYVHAGQAYELTRSNVFIVNSDGKIITPASKVLPGITRKQLIKGSITRFPVEERDLFLEEIYDAQEVFITGTTKKVLPVVRVNNRLIGSGKPGDITKDAMSIFDQIVNDYLSSL